MLKKFDLNNNLHMLHIVRNRYIWSACKTYENHSKTSDGEGELRRHILAVGIARVPGRAHQQDEHRRGDELGAQWLKQRQLRAGNRGAEAVLVVRVFIQNTQRGHHL